MKSDSCLIAVLEMTMNIINVVILCVLVSSACSTNYKDEPSKLMHHLYDSPEKAFDMMALAEFLAGSDDSSVVYPTMHRLNELLKQLTRPWLDEELGYTYISPIEISEYRDIPFNFVSRDINLWAEDRENGWRLGF